MPLIRVIEGSEQPVQPKGLLATTQVVQVASQPRQMPNWSSAVPFMQAQIPSIGNFVVSTQDKQPALVPGTMQDVQSGPQRE